MLCLSNRACQPASILIPGGGLCFLMDNLCLPWNIYSDDKTDVCLYTVSLSNLVKLFRGFFLSYENIRACANYVLAALNDFCQSWKCEFWKLEKFIWNLVLFELWLLFYWHFHWYWVHNHEMTFRAQGKIHFHFHYYVWIYHFDNFSPILLTLPLF